jgi:DNA-binding NarL/FixJ family response regulator
VVAEGADGDQAVELVQANQPDVVIMDISMQRMSGLDALVQLRAQWPSLPVIMLSMHAQRDLVMRAIRGGASAYLPKEAAETELELALNAVLAGPQYHSPAVSGAVIDSLLQRPPATETEALTARQREVLRLLALGRNTKEVAYELSLSVKTVESHRAQIMERLAIRDLASLVVYAIRNGIIQLE